MISLLSQSPPQYPVPPSGLSASHAASMAFTVICVAFMVVAVVWVIRLAMQGETLGIFFLGAGLLMGGLEPYFDYIGLLWFADDNVAVTVNLFGRHIPLYVVLGYSFFFGLQSYIAYRAIHLGRSAMFFVYAYVVAWIFDFALQATGRAFGLYEYYGQQPFLIAGAPGWWFSIDAALPILAGLVFFALRERLVGWGQLIVVPILPGLYAGLNGAVGVPVFTALNSNFDEAANGNGSVALVWLGGTITIALALFTVWVLIGEIGKAQRRAGITVDTHTRLSDVLLAKVGVGINQPHADSVGR